MRQSAGTTQGKRSQDVLTEMRAATWLRLVGPEKAIQYAVDGRKVPPERLPELATAMMDETLTEAREGRPSYPAKLLAVGVQLMAIDLLEQASTGAIRPAQLPMSIRLAQQALEAFGGGKLAFANINVDFGGIEEEEK